MHLVTHVSIDHILACIGLREARLEASQPDRACAITVYQFSCHLSEQGTPQLARVVSGYLTII